MGNSILWVGLGGGTGSILRYLIQRNMNSSFPYGTLTVNFAGCFLIGMLWGLTEKYSWNPTYKLLLITGFCGGFTTFSAFTQEGIGLLGTQKVLPFFIYTALSVAGGFLFTYLAYKIFS